MKYLGRLQLSGFDLMIFLCLVSCATKSNNTETPLILTTTPPAIPTLIHSNATQILVPLENSFSISPGRLLFVSDSVETDATSPHDLISLNLETNEQFFILDKDQELNGQTISISYPNITWSPDGHWIAFVGTDFSKPFWQYAYEDIYIVKSDGTELQRLTYSPRYNKWDIAWSPDGKYILVSMGINGSDLYLIDTANGEIVNRLTSSGNNHVAVWAPDGDKIAYLEDSVLSIMNVADETSQQISIPSNYSVLDISWSPNEEQIAFVSSVNDSKCADVFVINIDTGGITNLTSSEYYERTPDWLPDGDQLIFLRSVYTCDEQDGQADWDIYITNLLGEEHEIVSSVGSSAIIAWSPVPSLEIGKQYTITKFGELLNLRSDPSLNGNILEKLPAGEIITVLEGFVDADDYYWWKIRIQDGTEGWVVEVANWYKSIFK
ncbi:MAG: PD40 domain-containing protein [Anaerolineales bacterium]|nr:PD40 domain-containing protein [Anaerolineales bacterium]